MTECWEGMKKHENLSVSEFKEYMEKRWDIFHKLDLPPEEFDKLYKEFSKRNH